MTCCNLQQPSVLNSGRPRTQEFMQPFPDYWNEIAHPEMDTLIVIVAMFEISAGIKGVC